MVEKKHSHNKIPFTRDDFLVYGNPLIEDEGIEEVTKMHKDNIYSA